MGPPTAGWEDARKRRRGWVGVRKRGGRGAVEVGMGCEAGISGQTMCCVAVLLTSMVAVQVHCMQSKPQCHVQALVAPVGRRQGAGQPALPVPSVPAVPASLLAPTHLQEPGLRR